MLDKIKDMFGGGDFGDLAELQKYVEGLDFPISKDELIVHVQESGLQDDLVAKLQNLDQDQFKDSSDLINSVKDLMNK